MTLVFFVHCERAYANAPGKVVDFADLRLIFGSDPFGLAVEGRLR